MSIIGKKPEEDLTGRRFYTLEEYDALPRDTTPWLIENLIPAGGAILCFGKPKTGKSYLSLAVAFAVADESQQYWLDPSFKVRKHGKVMYLQVDTPRPAWQARLDLIKARHNFNTDGRLHIADTVSAPYPFDILNPGNHAWLTSEVKRVGPDLVIIDTLREVHGLDEDSSTAMRNVIARLVAATTPAAMMLVSHSRKGVADREGKYNDDIMDAARGSGYVVGRMDSIIRLTDKHLYTKGRAYMDASFPVRQEPGTGLLLPDYEQDEIEMQEVMKGLIITPSAKPEELDTDKLKMLMVLYPDASKDSITKKFQRMKAKEVVPPDQTKMRYTMADITQMLARVNEGKHPANPNEPMPDVRLSDARPNRRAKKKE